MAWRLAALIRGAELAIIPGARHMLPQEHARELNELLQGFRSPVTRGLATTMDKFSSLSMASLSMRPGARFSKASIPRPANPGP